MPELPPPLPPETRTVGQVIAETIRAYGADFWRALPLGLPLAIADQVSIKQTSSCRRACSGPARRCSRSRSSGPAPSLHERPPTWTAFWLAALIWLPFPPLRAVFILPGLGWLAFIGLAVPAAIVEGLGFRSALVAGSSAGHRGLHPRARVARGTGRRGRHRRSDHVPAASFAGRHQPARRGLPGRPRAQPAALPRRRLLYLDQAARVGSRRRGNQRSAMPIFILLSRLTQQGVQTSSRTLNGFDRSTRTSRSWVQGAASVGDARRIRFREHRRGSGYDDGRAGLGLARRPRVDPDRDPAGARDRGLSSARSSLIVTPAHSMRVIIVRVRIRRGPRLGTRAHSALSPGWSGAGDGGHRRLGPQPSVPPGGARSRLSAPLRIQPCRARQALRSALPAAAAISPASRAFPSRPAPGSPRASGLRSRGGDRRARTASRPARGRPARRRLGERQLDQRLDVVQAVTGGRPSTSPPPPSCQVQRRHPRRLAGRSTRADTGGPPRAA